jgi:hypothetical protein
VGARIRRWWWRTNNWPIEGEKKGSMANGKYAEQVGDVGSVPRPVKAWLTGRHSTTRTKSAPVGIRDVYMVFWNVRIVTRGYCLYLRSLRIRMRLHMIQPLMLY